MTALLRAVALLLAALALPGSAHAADAVVGFVDTGINPYHKTFRDPSPRAQQHPSTYLPGFPADAEALRLTFDAPDYESAVIADCEVWRQVEPGKLYWVPGTKIVGAIAFRDELDAPVDCGGGEPPDALILDTNGHGTMVASRAASNEYGACRTCRIVAIHYPNNGLEEPAPYQDALRWAAAHRTWLDAQSNSWGPIVPAYEPTGEAFILAGNPPLIRTIEATAGVQLAFWASMNGAAGRAGAAGHPTPLAPHLTPSVLSVGGHDSGYVTVWPGFPPHVAADACNAFGAYWNHMDKSDGTVSSGTSGATPYVAGGAAQILLDARELLGDARTGTRGEVMASGAAGLVASGPLADGVFTRQEWRELALKAASPRPEAQEEDADRCLTGLYDPLPVAWKDVPPGFPEYLNIGYGAVDRKAVGLAGQVLRGAAPMPDRAATDAYFQRDDELRRELHDRYTLGQSEEPPAAVPLPDAPAASPAPPPAPAAPVPSAPSPPAAATVRKVALSKLVRIRCRRSAALVSLRSDVREARVRLGARRVRLRRGTARVRLPRGRRARLVVVATSRRGERLSARGIVRCRR